MNNLKKTIEELLSGKFRYEQPGLLFSKEKIEVTLKAGDVYRGELYFGTEDNQRIRGYITSSNRRVVPGTDQFTGTTIRLKYGVDGVGMNPGDRHEGWLCFTTNVGEYRIPFVIQAEKEEMHSVAGSVTDMDSFVKIAKEDFICLTMMALRLARHRQYLSRNMEKKSSCRFMTGYMRYMISRKHRKYWGQVWKKA